MRDKKERLWEHYAKKKVNTTKYNDYVKETLSDIQPEFKGEKKNSAMLQRNTIYSFND